MPTPITIRKAKVAPKITIGGLIDEMSIIREKRRALDAESAALKKDYEALELQLIELMEADGCTKSTGHKATASISSNVNFNFEPDTGFDQFMAYVAKTKYFHLVQRRVSAPSVRELFESKGSVPGLVPFTKKEISLRNL